MKKNLFLSTITFLVIAISTNSVLAEPCYPPTEPQNGPMHNEDPFAPAPPPPHKLNPQCMEKMRKEHEKRKAHMDARLKLTEDQKKTIEQNRIHDRQKMKPLFEQARAKKTKIEEIKASNLNQSEKEKQISPLKTELKDIRAQINKLREENMKNFEAILTPKQKCELEKIKQEHKKEMEKRMKQHKSHPPFPPRT